MREYNYAYGVVDSVNNIIGVTSDEYGDNVIKVNEDSVQGAMLENVRRVAAAISMGRGQDNGRIGSGLTYDEGRNVVRSGYGFTANGGVVSIEDKVKTPTVKPGQSLYLNVELVYTDEVMLQSNIEGKEVQVIIDVNPIASLTPKSGDCIKVGEMDNDGVWKPMLTGFLAIKGDKLDANKVVSKEIVGDDIVFDIAEFSSVKCNGLSTILGEITTKKLDSLKSNTSELKSESLVSISNGNIVTGGTQTYTGVSSQCITSNAHAGVGDAAGGVVTGGVITGACSDGTYLSVVGGNVSGALDANGDVIPDFTGGASTGGVVTGLNLTDPCKVTYTSITTVGANKVTTVDGFSGDIVPNITGGTITGGTIFGGKIVGGVTTSGVTVVGPSGSAYYNYIEHAKVVSGGVEYFNGITSEGDVLGLTITGGTNGGSCIDSSILNVDGKSSSLSISSTGDISSSGSIDAYAVNSTGSVKADSISGLTSVYSGVETHIDETKIDNVVGQASVSSVDISIGNKIKILNGDITASRFIGNIFGNHIVGSIIMYALPYPPSGWVMCNGGTYDGTEGSVYRELWLKLKGAYGGTEGAFNVPNIEGRIPIGTNGGTKYESGRKECPPTPSGDTILSFGKTGGSSNVKLSLRELPNHLHNVPRPSSSATRGGDDDVNIITDYQNPTPTEKTASAGGGGYHNNMPPCLAVNYIIRF